MKKKKELFEKNKVIIMYLIFGAATTVVNIVCYFVLNYFFDMGNAFCTAAAWVISVLFAYVTNKLYVFEKKTTGTKQKIYEIASFFGCRLATGIMDIVFMVVTVDCLQWNNLICKITANVFVVIINYIVSKYAIFRNEKD